MLFPQEYVTIISTHKGIYGLRVCLMRLTKEKKWSIPYNLMKNSHNTLVLRVCLALFDSGILI